MNAKAFDSRISEENEIMGVKKHWLIGQSFARNFKRDIDRETLLDLLGIVIYEANRDSALEDAGFSNVAPSADCLFDYVLDAMEIPAESDSFSRSPFEELFYNDYWLEKKYESLSDVLAALESLKDLAAKRLATAEASRAGFRVVDVET